MLQTISPHNWPLRKVALTAVLLGLFATGSFVAPAPAPALAQTAGAALDFQRTDLVVEGLGPRGICAEDINNDEIPDLIVANLGTYELYQSQTLDVYYGRGDGTFKLVQSLPVGDGNQPYGIAASDLRGIDRLDVIVPNKDGKTVSVFLARADGTFEEPKAYQAGDAWSVSAGDVNGDNNLDLVVANFDSKAITILPGIGNGDFMPAITFAATADMQPRLIEFGDFNNDGRTDLVVPSDTFYGRVAIYFNNGSQDRISFTAPSIIRVGELTGYALVYDFNSDGNADIAASSATSNHITILLGKGDGTFALPQHYWTGDIWPFGMVLTDFNGDGKPDLVLAGVKGNTCGVLLGDGRGGFGSPYHFQVEGPSRWVAAADFDLDGKTDIAVGNYTVTGAFETDPHKFFKTVSVMLNHSNFTPARPAAFRVNCGGSALVSARNVRFATDGNFDGGTVITTTEPIIGTDDQALYRTARQGEFTYTAHVMAGRSYTLKLHLAELSAKMSKKRAMNISINGKAILQRFNCAQRAKLNTAFTIIRRTIWPDSNGQIRLEFNGKKGGAICSAISIY